MAILYILLILAVCFDVKTFRIPNLLIVIGYVLGFLYQFICRGGPIAGISLLEAVGIFLLLIPFFKLHAIGGGDVKLLSVCSLFMGFSLTVSAAVYALFVGAVMSVVYLVYHRIFSKSKKRNRNVIHFSIPIFFGVVIANIWGGILWQIF